MRRGPSVNVIVISERSRIINVGRHVDVSTHAANIRRLIVVNLRQTLRAAITAHPSDAGQCQHVVALLNIYGGSFQNLGFVVLAELGDTWGRCASPLLWLASRRNIFLFVRSNSGHLVC